MKGSHNDCNGEILSDRSIRNNKTKLSRVNKKSRVKLNDGQRQTGIKSFEQHKNINVINRNTVSASSKSALEKLDTIVSSDSYSMGSESLSVEQQSLNDMSNPSSTVTADERCGHDDRHEEHNDTTRRGEHSARDMAPSPPPPPQTPPPPQPSSNYVRLNDNDNQSVVSNATENTSGMSVTQTFSHPQKQLSSLKQHELSRQQTADHKKALLSLLQKLKESEATNVALQNRYEKENSVLMEHISKQEEHLNEVCNRLTAAKSELAKQKTSASPALVKVLMQLSNFAKGCNEYAKTSNSASVKKMSDALKVQVGEWAKVHDVNLSNNEEIATSSMDVIHSLQIQLKMLKLENYKLKRQSSSVNKLPSRESSAGGAASSSSQGSKIVTDDLDEVSHFSGMTSMSSCTKISAIGAFPTSFDKASIPPNLPLRTGKTLSSCTPPRSGRKVHIHTTPQVLTNDEDSTFHDDFSATSSNPQSIMKKSTYSKNQGHFSKKGTQSKQAEPHGFADFGQAFGGDDYREV